VENGCPFITMRDRMELIEVVKEGVQNATLLIAIAIDIPSGWAIALEPLHNCCDYV
jgi:hypothetical protein